MQKIKQIGLKDVANITINIVSRPDISIEYHEVDRTNKKVKLVGKIEGDIKNVEIYINGEWKNAEINGENWTYIWDITNANDGIYTIKVRAFDGRTYGEDSITLNVAKGNEFIFQFVLFVLFFIVAILLIIFVRKIYKR